MYPQTHFLFSWLVGLIFAKFGVFSYKVAFFIGVAAVLVDIDHYLVYIFKRKDMSLRHAFNKMSLGFMGGRSFLHHLTGFILVTAVVGFLYFYNSDWFWIIGLGYYTHMLFDYAHLNILKIKGKMTIKNLGFVERINKFEVLLDIFLAIGIVLLIL